MFSARHGQDFHHDCYQPPVMVAHTPSSLHTVILTEEKLDDISSIRNKPEVITSFGSSVWFRKKYSSRWYKVPKVRALQNYRRT
jgi:hypothetical protein